MSAIFDQKLSDEINLILKEPGAKLAVAFWGEGAGNRLNSSVKSKIICDLTSGGTNPNEIKKIMKTHDVRHLERLHAKVFIGRKNTIIASANVSSNGLGNEGDDFHNYEAESKVRTINEIDEWFEQKWNESQEISDELIRIAEERFEKRKRDKVRRRSFRNFNIKKKKKIHPLVHSM